MPIRTRRGLETVANRRLFVYQLFNTHLSQTEKSQPGQSIRAAKQTDPLRFQGLHLEKENSRLERPAMYVLNSRKVNFGKTKASSVKNPHPTFCELTRAIFKIMRGESKEQRSLGKDRLKNMPTRSSKIQRPREKAEVQIGGAKLIASGRNSRPRIGSRTSRPARLCGGDPMCGCKERARDKSGWL